LKETGAEGVASAGEASSDFAKTGRPVRRYAEHLMKDAAAETAGLPGETNSDLAKTDTRMRQAGV